MANTAAILLIGNELLRGDVDDVHLLNSAKQLFECDVEVKTARVVRDDVNAITRSLRELSCEVEIIICYGGLGPTSDDLTREAISAFFDKSLEEDAESLARLCYGLKRKGKRVSHLQLRQSLFPSGAIIFKNARGTADGFGIFDDGIYIASLPGVPEEAFPMLSEAVMPFLKKSNKRKSYHLKKAVIFGLAEAEIAEKITNLEFGEDLQMGYRPSFPYVYLVLRSQEEGLVSHAMSRIIEVVGREYFLENSLEEDCYELLKHFSKKIAVAESCTGGKISDLLVSIAGISNVYVGGVVSYANEAKQSMLGVDPRILEREGAVSCEVAKQMALGICKKLGADVGLSTTGIAGPGGGREEKPLGKICMGLSIDGEVKTKELNFSGFSRNAFRLIVSCSALDWCRRELMRLKV